MAKKQKKCECPAGEKWAVPYADFLSLLLALFIALYAISAVNSEKAQALKTELIKIFDFPDTNGLKDSSKNAKSATQFNDGAVSAQSGQNNLSQKQNKNNERYRVTLDQAENQIAIDLPTGIKFDARSADITDADNLKFIKIIAMMINKIPDSVYVDIRGFADDYNDNILDYQLGSSRAINVVKMLIENGVSPKRLFATSFGNKTQFNQDQKLVKIYFKVDVNDQKLQRSVLDVINEVK